MQDVKGTFDRSYQAAPESVARARADVAAFAVDHGVDPSRVDDIRLAVSEAVTNAVIHGYRETSGTVHIRARHADGTLWISVRDFGCGMQPRPMETARSGMGLGLALIGRVVGELSVAPQRGEGTDVRMRFDLVSAAVPAQRHLSVA
jgi:stage II sporulation protein AB (anti-sigma F factor)